jgi:hypothetical protein
MSRDRLEFLRSSAFESEHAWQYDTSYMEHDAAAIALEHEIEQSLASVSPDENSDEQIRIIKTQITIHRERQRALRPHLESGSGDLDGWGNECTFVPAPNHWGANGDLDEESETLSSVRRPRRAISERMDGLTSSRYTNSSHGSLPRQSLSLHPTHLFTTSYHLQTYPITPCWISTRRQ